VLGVDYQNFNTKNDRDVIICLDGDGDCMDLSADL
jgi:hypothetical protein